MSLIKTNFEFPRGDDPIKQGQRLAQDLSSNFRAVTKQIEDISKLITSSNGLVHGISGVEFSSSYSVTCPAGDIGASTYSFNHGLGIIPIGFIITDVTCSNTVYLTGPMLTRDSWDATQITIRVKISSLDYTTARTQTGTFKILILS